MAELSPSRSALARSTPVRAVVGMAMVVVGVLALWQQWLAVVALEVTGRRTG